MTQSLETPGQPSAEPAAAQVLEWLDVVVFHTDPAGNWTYLNEAWTLITGFAVTESIGTNFLDYVHPDERPETIALFMAVVAGGADHCHHRGRYRTSSGGYRQVELRSRVIRDEAGEITGNVGTLVDVSDRSAAEAALVEHRHLIDLASGAAVLDSLPLGVVLLDASMHVRRVSPVLAGKLGPTVTVGASAEALYDAFEPGAGATLGGPWGLVATALRTGRPQYADLRLPGASGNGLSFHVSVLPVPSTVAEADDDTIALVFQDVSDLRRAEEQQAAVAQLGQIALAGGDVADLLDEAVRVVGTTLAVPWAEVLELVGDGEGLLARAAHGWTEGVQAIDEVSCDPPPAFLARTLDGGAPVVELDLRSDSATQAHPWLAPVASSLTVMIGGGQGPAFGILGVQTARPRAFAPDEVGFLQAVANVLGVALERTRTEERTRHQALHDPLTGLANRTLFGDRLQQALAARRRTGRRVAVLLMDLDRFKEINDTLGHAVGDDVLAVVAARLMDATRDTDTVCRWGGDEFGVLLPGVVDVEDAWGVADKMRARVAQPLESGGLALTVQGSVGIALAPDNGEDATVLLKRADVAMYRAKRAPGGVAAYSRDSDLHRPDQAISLGALRAAIAADQVVVHVRRRVDLRSGAVTAFESVARWQHPREGLVGPETLLPLAERTGLVEQLIQRVLKLALAHAREWFAAGLSHPVAVDIPARVLHDTDLVETVRRELARFDLPPAALEVAVTEGALMANPANSAAVLGRLRETGVLLSLDDFGAGHSSLAHLRHLPVHRLKIHEMFARGAATDVRDAAIVRSIVDLGHSLGLTVIAKGVASELELGVLTELGCEQGQGPYLGHSGPARLVVPRGRAPSAAEVDRQPTTPTRSWRE